MAEWKGFRRGGNLRFIYHGTSWSAFMLFKNFPKRAKTFTERVHQGIYHGKGYMYGHVNTFSEKK